MWIEERHVQTQIGRDFSDLVTALGHNWDRDSVIRIASEALKCPPEEENGTVRVGEFEFTFDSDGKLLSFANSADRVVIQSEPGDKR